MKTANVNLGIGIMAWTIWALFNFQGGMQTLDYLTLVFLTAPCISMPISFHNYKSKISFQNSASFAAFCLVISYFYEAASLPALLFAIPWWMLALIFLLNSVTEWLSIKEVNFSILKLLAGIFWIVGASWMLADRIGFQPLGFDPTIVLLTAVHFHFAGFMLCSISYFVLQKYSLSLQRLVLIGLSIGIPAVAAGITLSKIYGPSKIELVGATFMATTGLFIAGLIIKYYTDPVIERSRNARSKAEENENIFDGVKIIGMISGLFLLFGMCFSLLYAWRNVLQVEFISIPWMWAVHGTSNALGFALLGAIAIKINQDDDNS